MESVSLVAPVTALEFAGGVLLAGTGPEVVAFRLSGGGTAARRTVLREASVLGLRPDRGPGAAAGRVAVFGGRWLAVLAVRAGGARLAVCGGGEARELRARVWEARWVPGGRLVLALGCGAVALYEWRGGGCWLRRSSCDGAGALRCAVLAGTGWTRLALAAGTAMGTVVVWRVAASQVPQRRLCGHCGTVLALCYSAPRGLLASASEDRSVRLWAVGDLAGGDGVGDGSCLLVCYGHGARVAAVVLRGQCPVSAGEDGACLEWDGGGDVWRDRRGHRGALRALALRPAGGCLATGGDDGGVRLWRPRRAAAAPVVALGSPLRPRSVVLAGPRRVLVLGEAGGLAAYEAAAGRWAPVLPPGAGGPRALLAASPLPSGEDTLCALAGGDGRLLLFALSCPGDATELRLFEGAVRGLCWAPRPGLLPGASSLLASGPDGEMLWLDVTHRPGRAPRVQVMGRYLLPLCKQRWHTCAAFLPQGGLLLCGDRRGSLLLFPCSRSSGQAVESASIANGITDLVVENATNPVYEDTSRELELSCLSHKEALPLEAPLSVLFGLHGKTGVTSVTCHGGYIYSTGRDGVYRQLRVQDQQLEVLWKHRPCKGLQWIEELRFTADGDLLVLGFHADNFLVWSSRMGENLHCIPCGGGHRSWSYCSSPEAEVVAFIKCGDVLLYQRGVEPHEQQVLLPSLHGRGITCVRRLGAVEVPGRAAVNIFVTGSEDTTACVLVLSECSQAAVPLTRLSDHVSSVRALVLAGPVGPGEEGFDDEGLSTLLFSAGGRAQIECYRLLCAADPASEGAVGCQVIHVASHRLDEHWERKKNRHKLVKMDPETRYMSLSVIPGTSTKQMPSPWKFLAAACSDGSVRLFRLLEATRKLVLVAESFHHQRCVLKVEAFLHTRAGGERRHLLCSAATDGSIAFWDITSPIADAVDALNEAEGEVKPLALGAPLLTVMAHSCGVNSLHIYETLEGRYLVASGSDDGSIHICLLEVTLDGDNPMAGACLHVLERVAQPCAHAAHVMGIRVLRPDLLLSASVDQRLTLWQRGPGGLEELSTTFFHVPDLAELDCWEGVEAGGEQWFYCVLCGVGLEMLRGTIPPEPPPSEPPQ
ncbi:tRNA (34-2'-O)-methyltransferase regulator WDR6 [Pezoporus flaviventris]|uniref:tRNA (34-2'-O)-methyltransferase regulator WDR6 n=1 Tax=Pezoporus flaviventris TaxID=889875 RepID=UPI002AB31524|nr:tRNA (34-2'-O)-methyltransferase regulator WDR6 [Pezoporus flaviventris]